MDGILMTKDASPLRHTTIARLNLDRFMKILKRKRERMKKAVIGLRDPFADRMVGQVAVVADSDMSVA